MHDHTDSYTLLEQEYEQKLQRLQNHYASLWIEIPDDEYENLRSSYVIERTLLEVNKKLEN